MLSVPAVAAAGISLHFNCLCVKHRLGSARAHTHTQWICICLLSLVRRVHVHERRFLVSCVPEHVWWTLCMVNRTPLFLYVGRRSASSQTSIFLFTMGVKISVPASLASPAAPVWFHTELVILLSDALSNIKWKWKHLFVLEATEDWRHILPGETCSLDNDDM